MVARNANEVVQFGRTRTRQSLPVKLSGVLRFAQGLGAGTVAQVRERAERPAKGVDMERAYATRRLWSQLETERRTRQSRAVLSARLLGM